METTLVLTQQDVARLLDMRTAIRVVRDAFKAQANAQTVMPPKVYLPLPHHSDFRAMPAYLTHPAVCGVKWVNVHPHNAARHLPTVMAIIIINDPATGFPLAIMDGLLLTRVRTPDGITLEGIVVRPRRRTNTALIWLHGLSSRFSSGQPLMAELAPRLTRAGIGYFKFNTRGHDVINRDLPKLGGLGGSAFERFEDCLLDIRAIIRFA